MIDREKIEEEIRQVAYEIYIKSGCIPGRDLDNWLEAERIVLAKYESEEISGCCEPGAEEKPKRKRGAKKGAKAKPKSKGRSKKS